VSLGRRARNVFAVFGSLSILASADLARGETSLVKSADGWEVYSTGRVGAFVEVLQGQGIPKSYADINGMQTQVHPVTVGGISVVSDPTIGPDGQQANGPILSSRVRSGFLGNVLAFGVRRRMGESTTVSAHVALWSTAETDSRRTFLKNIPDIREGYLKIDGPGGTLVAGRALSLFSRGATEIDFLYGHGYAVGNPAGFDDYGPSAGHIGYGVLANVFVAGVSYATPKLAGLQLTVGLYDPATLVGLTWTRSKLARPEGELTYDVKLGEQAKLHLFVNGAFQQVYKADTPDSNKVYGVGAGGRIEVGIVHLGVAGHYGQGLGRFYFLSGDDTVLAADGSLRKFDGIYAQSQFILGSFDLNFGWGMTRVYQSSADVDPARYDASTMMPTASLLKYQMGTSAVLVHHFSENLHGAIDYFRSDTKWWLGESQVVNAFNAGMTLTW